jgi:hypothetical protein
MSDDLSNFRISSAQPVMVRSIVYGGDGTDVVEDPGDLTCVVLPAGTILRVLAREVAQDGDWVTVQLPPPFDDVDSTFPLGVAGELVEDPITTPQLTLVKASNAFGEGWY